MILQTAIFVRAALSTLCIQLAGFIVAYSLKTEVFYDILGGINFLVLACFGLYPTIRTEVPSTRLISMTAVFVVSRGWLLLFLAWRAHHRKGDSRFDDVKDKFGLFLVFWLVQGCWVFFISWPLLSVQALEGGALSDRKLTAFDIITLVGFALGVAIEITADIQKALWVNRGREGGFCHEGLWKYSRHPNYWGEIQMWWCAWFLSSGSLFASSRNSWISIGVWTAGILSPVFTMTILLNMPATGVWNSEGSGLKRYYESENAQEYKIYRESTSPLVPMIGYKNIPIWVKRFFLFEWERFEYKPNKNE